MNLKSTALIILFTFISTISFAQSQKSIFFDRETQITKFHTIDELENLKKGDLITLYKERINEIITVLPYLALTNQPEVSLSDIGIKEDSDHLKILKQNHESTSDALETTKEMIGELVPYADTEKIIWSILYYEEIIKKIRIGIDGNF